MPTFLVNDNAKTTQATKREIPHSVGESDGDVQRVVVTNYFSQASANWGDRYQKTPTKMSDLDLFLRRERAAELLRPYLSATKKIVQLLDVGCGAGSVAEALPRERLRIQAVDLVANMVEDARNRGNGDGFCVADAGKLPFADGAFDVVACLGVLEYIPKPLEVLQSMHKVLAPGGLMVVSFPNRDCLLRKITRWEAGFERCLMRVLRRHQEAPQQSYQHTSQTVAFVKSSLHNAGFHIEALRFHSYGLWGRIGRWKSAVAFSRRLSQRFCTESLFSRRFAHTMVVLAISH